MNKSLKKWTRWVNKLWPVGWIKSWAWMKDDKGLKYLEIIRYKAIDNRIHTTIQTTESHSQVIHNHMMRHVWIEIHHHLQHENDTHNHLFWAEDLLQRHDIWQGEGIWFDSTADTKMAVMFRCNGFSLTHLRDVEGCETDSEDDQHCAQQLNSPPSSLPEQNTR